MTPTLARINANINSLEAIREFVIEHPELQECGYTAPGDKAALTWVAPDINCAQKVMRLLGGVWRSNGSNVYQQEMPGFYLHIIAHAPAELVFAEN